MGGPDNTGNFYISREIMLAKRIRVYCTSYTPLSPLCVNIDMLVLLSVLPHIFQQNLGVVLGGHRSLDGCLMLPSRSRHFQASP